MVFTAEQFTLYVTNTLVGEMCHRYVDADQISGTIVKSAAYTRKVVAR